MAADTKFDRPGVREIVHGMMQELEDLIGKAGGFGQANVGRVVSDYLEGLPNKHPDWVVQQPRGGQGNKDRSNNARTLWRVEVVEQDGKLALVEVFDDTSL